MKRIMNPLTLLAMAALVWSFVGVACAQDEKPEAEKPAAEVESSEEIDAASDSAASDDSAGADNDLDAAEEPEPEPAVEKGSGHDDDAEHAGADSDHGHSEGEHNGANGDHGEGHSGGHGAHHDLGHGDASPTLEDPSALSKDLAIYTFVVFLGLLTLLGRFAWPTITEALEAREKRIEQNIADAESKLEDAKALVSKHESKLAGAADQVRELLAEAHRDAEATIAKAKTDAKAEFEAERLRATRDIEQASDAAVRQLAEKTAGLAIDLAGRVVKQDISADRQSEIVREALGAFANSGPSVN